MKVLFLHGLESKPGGTKARELKSAGHDVLNPALPRGSFWGSVKIAQDIVDTESPDYIVGSSRGGAVAMALNPGDARIVLIAPAWKKFGVTPDVPATATVLHSPADDLVPIEDSVELVELTGAELVECGTCHRMSDDEALDTLLRHVF